MEDYKPNSNRFKENQKAVTKTVEKKKVEKIISGKATVKKKGEIRKFADNFISEEAPNVGRYIWKELVVPTIKQTIVDAIKNSADIIFNGSINSRGGARSSNPAYVSYNRYSSDRGARHVESRVRGTYEPEDLIFDNKGDADGVLKTLDEIMAEYGLVRVSDLYDLAGVNSAPYTANRYGWTNIRTAEVVHVREGWVIKLPRAIPID